MAKYISNWYGIYPNSAGDNSATNLTNLVSTANDYYNYFLYLGAADYYEYTSTYISGYLYDYSDFQMFGSGFYTNLLTINELDIFAIDDYLYAYTGNVQYNVITGVQSGSLNQIVIATPFGERVDIYGNINVAGTTATINKITDQYADGTITLNGSLIYNYLNDSMSGNITSYQFVDNFGHSYTLSNFSIPFSQLDLYSNLDSFVADIMAGNDNIVGTTAADVILGYAGNDVLDGAAGADTLVGGIDNDTYIVDNIGDIVIENVDEGTDLVKVNIATANGIYTLGDNIENGTLINSVAFNLSGNTLNNILIGNVAANTLNGNEGADTMIGGSGNDIYVVDQAGDIVTELLNAGIDTVQSSITYSLFDTDAAGLNGGNVENLTLIDVANIDGIGNAFNNVLIGNAGANLLDGLAGNDSLIGGDGTDTLIGGLGNDSLDGGTGTDNLTGGDGNDTYIIDDASDAVAETNGAVSGGIDTVKSSAFNYSLTSNVENLTLTNNIDLNGGTANINGTGNALNNIITGNAGDNILDGAAGNDSLIGGDGADTLTGDAGLDALTGGKGNDTYNIDLIRASALATSTVALQDTVSELANAVGSTIEGIDTINLTNLTGNAGAPIDTTNITNATTLNVNTNVENFDASQTGNIKLNITGNALNNTITGNDADNVLLDSTGNDTIIGGAGNDTLDGGLGLDTLVGGTGNDTYLVDIIATTTGVAPAPIVVTGATLQDVVTEVNGTTDGIDTLRLRGNVVIPATTAETEIALTGALANIENLDISLTGVSRLNLTGSDADNILTGNAAVNTLTGGLGNDTLNGGLGADILIGGAGDDTYIVDNAGDNILEDSNQGTDTANSSISFDLSTRGANVENLTLTNGTLNGGTTAINGTGNDLDNTITGNAGANILNGGLGADTLIGGAGNDTYVVDNDNDVVVEINTGGIDLVRSSVSFDLGTSGANVENLTLTGTTTINGAGNTLNNIMTGNAGNNTLDGATGVDSLVGGLGDDQYVVDLVQTGTSPASLRVALQDTITEALNAGTDTLTLRGNSFIHNVATTLTLGANLENLDASDTGLTNLNLTGNALNNTITGNDADNVLLDSTGNDTLIGGAGNDTLDGGLGLDTLVGGTGNDTYLVDIVASGVTPNLTVILQDTIIEDNGTTDGIDTLRLRGNVVIPATTAETEIALTGALANIENLDISLTGVSRLNITGNEVNNFLIGNTANNIINGGAGEDFIDGKAGADTMVGGAGEDTYLVDNINDLVIEQSGEGNFDYIYSTISYDLSTKGANVEYLELLGTAANGTGNDLDNSIFGNSLANILTGGGGNDSLNGGLGNDTLDGGAGSDILTGGNGNDIYIVDNIGDTVIETNNISAIGGIDLIKSSVSYDLSVNGINVENLTLFSEFYEFGFIDGTGNSLANIITGTSANNVLYGGVGVDTLIGGNGNDFYKVDLRLLGIEGTATASVILEDNVIETSDPLNGNDQIQLLGQYNLAKASTIILSTGIEGLDASLTGNTLLNFVGNGGNGINGNDADNIITGGNYSDYFNGGAGNDTLNGGLGEDQLRGETGHDIIDGGAGIDILTGGSGNDTYIVDIIANTAGTNVRAALQDEIFEASGTTEGIDTLILRGSVVIPATAVATNIDLSFGSLWPVSRDPIDRTNSTGIENLDISLTSSTKLDLTGNDLDNKLTGNAAVNIIIGGLGNDTLDGRAGADTMNGGTGDDTYFVDLIRPTTGAGGDVIIDSSGTDTVKTIFSADLKSTQFDGIENLTLLGTAALNATGDESDNLLIGNDSGNILDGGIGADDMDGGKGNDTYIVDDLGDDVSELFTVALGGGIDLLKSSVDFELDDNIENLTLTNGTANGGTANINGTGNDLANTIIGNAGANIIDGDDGADRMTGNDGSDTYFVDNIGDVITETNTNAAIGGIDTVNSEISYTLGANLENLTLTGDDNINGTGNTLANNIIGNAGDNILDGGASTTIVDTLTGGAGNDGYVVDLTVTGTGDATSFVIQDTFTESADQGIDTLRLRGTLGYLTARTLLVNDYAGQSIEGLDVSLTGSSKINLTGNSADNILVGNAFTNTLIGDAGNDILDGKTGADILNGGAGDDTYFVDVIKPVGAGGDVIIEDNIALNFGNDTVNTTFSADLNSTQFDGIENITLITTALNATGDDGDNELIGNASANTIKGGAGDDEITGGAGNDILTGGFGADTFVWELADKGTNGRPAIDRITDFNIAEDKLDLRDLLEGESGANILNFLDVTTSTAAGVTNTEIRVSNTGGFSGGIFATASENQHITLAGVNLLIGTNETDLLATLIAQNKLIIDV